MKVVLVTGVSRGIGKCIVDILLKSSDHVVVYGISRSEGSMQYLKELYNERFHYMLGDVTDEGKLRLLIDTIISKHGKIDSVVANAGILEPVASVNYISVGDWKKLFDINFFSIVSLVSLTIDHLSKSNGNFIFVSSGASVKPYYGWGAYGASKSALNHLAMTIAEENKDVKVISVAPGVVDTQMQVDIREKFGPESMTPETLKGFLDLKTNNELLESSVPAKIYANLALRGIPEALNGKYIRYNDDELSVSSD